MDGGEFPPPPATGGDEAEAAPAPAPAPAPSTEEGPGSVPVGYDALARAISATLGAMMRESDSRVEGAGRSQDELARSINRLTGELDKLLEDAPLPFIMQHAAKISFIRKRVSSLNLLLMSIQRRIDNIDRILSTGIPIDEVPPDIVETSSLTL